MNELSRLDRANQAAFALIGAAIEVHRHLGPGYLEAVYEEALVIELGLRGIAFERQVPISILYKGHNVATSRLDLVIENVLVVELKAIDAVLPIHRAQVLSYLKASSYELGLLINFKAAALKEGIARVILNR
jgi:GxxExxY protein